MSGQAMKKIFTMLAFLLITGCASTDFYASTFQKSKTDADYQYFNYTSFADQFYPKDSVEAENIRIFWLHRWLHKNNIADTDYEILKRDEAKIKEDIYKISYQIRIKK